MHLVDSLFGSLSHCSEQSKVLALNVANLNTPSFKAKSLSSSFVCSVPGGFSLNLFRTSELHISSSNRAPGGVAKLEKMIGEEKPNGNDVNILEQMSAMSKNSDLYELSSALFKGAFDFVHLAHGGSSR
jgi:flagellar basal-body rod protein FlgB